MAWKAYLDPDENNTTSYDIAIENSENGEIVAYAYEQDEANLIAAAPELLQALKWAAEQTDFTGGKLGDVHLIKNAIAKAEGRDGTD